ncbi:winged helix-turn-helix domain-containing protein [Lysobacter sp. CA196]|uniref:winged helix-turn-helix domain-containing protein n=1 Tax=Lysobacter sp. CA196 TaxID=3455606 RepID=UPI003F8D14A4
MTDILLIEDDERLGTLIANYLRKHGYLVVVETDGAQAVGTILEHAPTVVLLDLSLPGQDGFEICRAVRSRYGGVICMLTARIDDIDQVLGLELGADDYIGKPIEPRVLLARLRAHMRRDSAARQTGSILRFGQLCIERDTREVTLYERRIELTTAEFDLLALLADRAGQILSRDDLLRNLRGINFDGLDRSIDGRISRLRRKLGDLAEEPERIKTVRGRGYLFNRAAWE